MRTAPYVDPRTRQRLVLVVDDDDEILDALTGALSDEGYRVLGARNGEEALALLRGAAELPAVVLLDLMMPRKDGWTFRAEQRREPHLVGIPVVVMSAARNLGRGPVDADDFVSKPIDLGYLLGVLARFAHRA